MEPNEPHGRLIHMTRNLAVDTSALYTLAADYRGHSIELAAHAADLVTIAGEFDVFGPVGAAFAATLAEATRHQAQLAHGLSAHLDTGGTTTIATATGFLETDHDAGNRIGAWR